MSVELQKANLSLKLSQFDKQRNEQNVYALKMEAETLERKIDRAMKRAERSGQYSEVDVLEKELGVVRCSMANARMEAHSDLASGVKRCRQMLEGEEGLLDEPIKKKSVDGDNTASDRDNSTD